MVRKSLIGVIVAAAILVGGIWAGRLVAGPLGHGRRFSAQQIFSRVADRLDLSDTQREQVREVLKAHKDAILAAIQQTRTSRAALRQAIDADPVDEAAIRARAAEVGRVEADASVLRAQIRSEILPILNDDQRQKMAAFRTRVEGSGDRIAGSVRDFLAN
jgi:Spy/CpxP family protein refolding chaperone